MEEILNFEVFIKYKKAIKENKGRYKLALLKALEEDKLEEDKFIFLIYKEIIGIWENDWKEEPNVYVDKLKFHDWIFKKYKKEIKNDKERYKVPLLELLEEDKIDEDIYKEIIDIWEKGWKEEVNIYIDNLKFKNRNLFQEYKEEIGKNKERYKLILLELLEKNKISQYIYKEIIDIWEKNGKMNLISI